MGWKSEVRTFLDRPGRRWAMVPFATASITVKERTPCLVWPVDGGWMHRYPGGTYAGGDIGAPPPARLDRETHDVFLFSCQLRPGDTVLDVGAGTGEEVRTFSRLVAPTGRVVAVEAHPTTFSLLVRNCSSSAFGNVVSVNRAVTDSAGVVFLTNDGTSVGNRLVSSGDRVAVDSSSLDDLADELSIGPVALLKMNIEGAERLAIRGMDRLIRRTDNVCISCHDFLVAFGGDESMKTKEVVRAFLEDQGFRIRTRDHDPRPWVRDYLYGSRNPS